MFYTDESSQIRLNPSTKELFLGLGDYSAGCKNQHLYFLSDEEKKEDDWCINNNNRLIQYKQSIRDVEVCKKVIATTDEFLNAKFGSDGEIYGKMKEGLPQPSQSFITKFVDEYNAGRVITEVIVEYEFKCGCQGRVHDGCDYEEPRLKVNTDNTITIKPIKDMSNKITKITEKLPQITELPNGRYQGVWSGYCIELKYEDKTYELTTEL